MDKLAKDIIKEFTPAYESAKEIMKSGDEDKMVGALYRLVKLAEEGDPSAIVEIVVINYIAEHKGL